MCSLILLQYVDSVIMFTVQYTDFSKYIRIILSLQNLLLKIFGPNHMNTCGQKVASNIYIYIQQVDLHTLLHRRQEHVESAEGAAQARMHLHAPIRDL